MKKRIPILIILLAAAGYAIYALRTSNSTPANHIVVSGNIELTEVNIAFKTAGRLIERTVDEGDPVKKGQIIARLDSDQLTAQRDMQAAALASSESQLAQAITSVEWEKQNLAGDIEQRRGDVVANEAHLTELRNGARPQEKVDAQANVEGAQAEVDHAQKDWDRAQVLYKNDDISTAQYDQYRKNLDATKAALKSAREKASLVLAGPREETIHQQEGQVERVRGALKMAEANDLEMKRREQEIGTRKAEIARSRANLALIDAQLADTIAVSPVDGVVLVKSADVGEVLSTGTSIVTIGDIEHPWLRGYINETDLPRIKLGDKAKVTTDAGKTYEGRITFISSEAEFTPKQIQTQQERVKLVYRIKIEVANPNHELKSNMPVDAEIVLN